jgi:hypothetical protein
MKKYSDKFDAEAAIREARGRGYDLRRIMQEHGCAFPGGGRKTVCPFCQKDASVFEKQGKELFKCWHDNCRSGNKVLDEVGFIGAHGNLGRKEAFVAYLKMAGVWKDVDRIRGNGQKEEVRREKEEGRAQNEECGTGNEEGISDQAAVEVVSGRWEDAVSGPGGPPSEENTISDLAQSSTEVAGPAGEVSPELAMAAAAPSPSGVEAASAEAPELNSKEEGTENKEEGRMQNGELGNGTDGADDRGGDLAGGCGSQTRAPADGEPAEGGTASAPNVVEFPRVGKRASLMEMAWRAVLEFYGQLVWTDEDAEKCFLKRGLDSETQEALGFRSNRKENQALLEGLKGEFSVMELIESGLWVAPRQGKPARPNAQFYGYGIAGKREKKAVAAGESEMVWGWTYPILIPYFDRDGVLRKIRPHKGGAPGEKTMGKSRLTAKHGASICGQSMVYVPRPRMVAGKAAAAEHYKEVVICEGEFKAAAIWQELRFNGLRGACALPGISMAKSPDLREELEMWLQAVGAQVVYVGFDREKKDTPGLANFKEDWTKRHDTLIYAQYLAIDLKARLGLRTFVCQLPEAWMENGKADWDGAAAKFGHGN